MTKSVFISIFALVDSEDQCVPVTVYNMAAGAGFAVGDAVGIPEPFCQETNFTENDKVGGLTYYQSYFPRILLDNIAIVLLETTSS